MLSKIILVLLGLASNSLMRASAKGDVASEKSGPDAAAAALKAKYERNLTALIDLRLLNPDMPTEARSVLEWIANHSANAEEVGQMLRYLGTEGYKFFYIGPPDNIKTRLMIGKELKIYTIPESAAVSESAKGQTVTEMQWDRRKNTIKLTCARHTPPITLTLPLASQVTDLHPKLSPESGSK